MAGAHDDRKEISELIRSVIKEDINVVVNKLNTIVDDISTCVRRLGAVEDSLPKLDSRLTKLELENETLNKTNAELRERTERLEMQSRKYNLRLFGLPGDVGKDNLTNYTDTLFKELFRGRLAWEPEVEMAHWIRVKRNVEGRVMMVPLRRFITKEEIIKIAIKELKIFPDLTSEMANK